MQGWSVIHVLSKLYRHPEVDLEFDKDYLDLLLSLSAGVSYTHGSLKVQVRSQAETTPQKVVL